MLGFFAPSLSLWFWLTDMVIHLNVPMLIMHITYLSVFFLVRGFLNFIWYLLFYLVLYFYMILPSTILLAICGPLLFNVFVLVPASVVHLMWYVK